MIRPLILAAVAILALSACGRPAPDGINDPYEPMNRRVHAFNRGVDARLVRPLSAGLKGNAGQGAGQGKAGATGPHLAGNGLTAIGNFGANLGLPVKVVNHLLQGRPAPAVRMTFRFAVNSTLGLAGLSDPATGDFALPEEDTDFGATLAAWGVAEGPYLELPLIGPSTARDATGRLVDLVIDPVGRAMNRDQRLIALGAKVVSKAGERARFGDSVDSILHESADSYAQTRLIWLEHRRHELGQQGDDIDPYAE